MAFCDRNLIAGAIVLVLGAGMARAQPTPGGLVMLRATDIGVDRGDTGRSIGGRLLFNSARYHPGDDLAWAEPDYDDGDWEVAYTGLRSDILPASGWPGVGWFRSRLNVDESLRGRDIAFSIQHAGALEIYLDGRLVFRTGTVGRTKAEEVPALNQDPFTMPLEPGKEHLLALRYSNFVSLGFRSDWYFAGPGLYWGDRNTMIHHRQSLRYNQGFFTAFFLAFTLLFALLFGIYRSEKLFLYLAGSYAALVPFIFIGKQVSFLESPRWVMPAIDILFVAGVVAVLAELVVVYAFFYQNRPRLFIGYVMMGLMTVAGIVFRFELVILFLLLLVLVDFELIRVVVLALWRRKRWSWIVAVGVLPGIAVQVWDEFEKAGVVTAPWTGSTFSPGVISSVTFAAASAVYVGVRFAEAQRGLAELETARNLQLSMLPDRVPRHPDIDIAVYMQTASQVGGDYYDFDVAEDGTLTFAIGDATGHGTSAGILVTATKTLWSAFSRTRSLAEVLTESNQAIRRMNLPRLYMALALGRYRDASLELAGVGMPPALLFRTGERKLEEVQLKGVPLGGPGDGRVEVTTVELSPGDTVLLMTDGFPERFNSDGEMLGYERATRLFAGTADQSPDEIVASLIEHCEQWGGGRKIDDDVTFVVLRMKAT